MNHNIKDYTHRDLLAVICSPHTTPQQKREALDERTHRNQPVRKQLITAHDEWAELLNGRTF